MTASSLPEAIEYLKRGVEQIFGRMNATPFVAEEWSFKMNAERAGVGGVPLRILCGLDCVGKLPESRAGCIEWRGDGGREV